MRLGAKYKVRLMADESLSWGVLGENGRGVTEHYNLPVSAIDVIIGSLAASLGSVGGFCVGKCVTTLQLPLPMRPSPTTALPLQPRGHRPPAPCWCWVLFLGVCASVPVCYCQVGVATHDGVFPRARLAADVAIAHPPVLYASRSS